MELSNWIYYDDNHDDHHSEDDLGSFYVTQYIVEYLNYILGRPIYFFRKLFAKQNIRVRGSI